MKTRENLAKVPEPSQGWLVDMKTSEFEYNLPKELIAQTPMEPRDASRLLVLHRASGVMEHRVFRDIGEYLRPGDLLVANESRVIPARLYGRKAGSGGRVELLLVARRAADTWEALVRGRKLGVGAQIEVRDKGQEAGEQSLAPVRGEVVGVTDAGGRLVRFSPPIEPLLDRLGLVPLPPYIHTPLADPERYQTVYARIRGSVAAPTAGLHFTLELIQRLQAQGVRFAFVTLHIGLDTFRPIGEEEIEQHQMHAEYCAVGEEAVQAVRQTKAAGGRVIAVGTTAVRALESSTFQVSSSRLDSGNVKLGTWNLEPFADWTSLYICPGYQFRVVDAMITNFHLPRSTLLCLVSAFAGRELILRAYAQAMRLGYRFYSFGDAMLLL
jgi:S-adenosylmethionine:tRNA ribosyltransferase-isomerase